MWCATVMIGLTHALTMCSPRVKRSACESSLSITRKKKALLSIGSGLIINAVPEKLVLYDYE